MSSHRHIDAAFWIGPGKACVLLSANWEKSELPPLKLTGAGLKMKGLERMHPRELGRFTGFYESDDAIHFCLNPERFPHVDFDADPVRVAGTFNDWGRDGRHEEFTLSPCETDDGKPLYCVRIDRSKVVCAGKRCSFKFVTESWHWLTPLRCAPNVLEDKTGNLNYVLNAARTGRHAFVFDTGSKRGMDRVAHVEWAPKGGEAEAPRLIVPGLAFYDLESRSPLGSRIEKGNTVFRLFAPRATKVRLEVFEHLEGDKPQSFPLDLLDDLVTWEVTLKGNFSGWFYRLYVDGPDDGLTTAFDKNRPLLDPYAKAVCGPEGPGVVLDATKPAPGGKSFTPPRWEDLSILECHVRDLAAHAPIEMNERDRLGFNGVTRFLADRACYLRTVGVNTLEFQPVQQFDSRSLEDYHWGYMTNNFFAPCAWYGSDISGAAQNEEFGKMVDVCHKNRLSVIVDVVYNHVGEPPNLLFIDKAYYFHVDADGGLINWSGTGNVLRTESRMALKLVIESLVYLVETYDLDGFRFDLAELLTIESLKRIGDALRKVKPSIILIAEPWSFRGSVQWDARMAGFAFWNDGFREFARDYVLGHSNADALRYYAKGCLDHMAAWPSQSVNYVESHDDRCWIDRITENQDHNGEHPTHNDRMRSHMAAALIYCAVGIPMISAGQDFLKSKQGIHNTYQRGDINAIRYDRIQHFGQTHHYFRQWIAFRQSEWGAVLRLKENPTDGYLQVFKCEHSQRSAAALLFNADRSLGNKQVLLALNPHFEEHRIHLGEVNGDDWIEIADIQNFNFDGILDSRLNRSERRIVLPGMDLGLWVRGA